VRDTLSPYLIMKLRLSELRIDGEGCSLWLTPNAMDSLPPREPEALMKQMEKNRPGRTTLSTLREQVVYEGLWPTPTTINRNSRNAIMKIGSPHQNHGAALGLEQVAELKEGILPKEFNSIEEVPAYYIKFWPTPKAQNANAASIHGEGGMDLQTAVQMWPTPRAFCYKDSTTDRGRSNLGEVVGGQLNPTWVEWLMGFPTNYTEVE
jgi:hypothetical protein